MLVNDIKKGKTKRINVVHTLLEKKPTMLNKYYNKSRAQRLCATVGGVS